MANVDNPNGAKPVGTISGAPWQGLIRSYMADGAGSDIFIGDFVVLNTDGYVDVAAAGGTDIVGVCVGFQPAQAGQTNMITDHYLGSTSYDLSKKYYDASADGAAWILVCVGTDVLYEIQEDGDTTPLTLAEIGNNVDIIATAGDTTKGHSQQEINSDSNVATTAQLRVIAPVNRPDNELGSTGCRWIVKINESHYTGAGL